MAKKRLLQVYEGEERAITVNGQVVYVNDDEGLVFDFEDTVAALEKALGVKAEYVRTEQPEGDAMDIKEQWAAWERARQGAWQDGKPATAATCGQAMVTPGVLLNSALAPAVGWRIEKPTVPSCGLVTKGSIRLSDIAYRKIETALDEMGNSEWLAYLLGTVDNSKAQVEDLLVPEQTVTSCSVHVLEVPEDPPEGPKVIGTVHSHGSNAVSPAFSGTDKEHIVGNYPVSLLVGKNYKGVIRVQLPCGRGFYLDADVVSLRPEADEGFRAELKARARKLPVAYQQAELSSRNFWEG